MQISKKKYHLAVLASGRGSNFRAVQKAIDSGELPDARIVHLITDRSGTKAADFAQAQGIPLTEVLYRDFPMRKDFDHALSLAMDKIPSDYFLALGFMRILGPEVLENRKNKIINIHPSLLPAFPGVDAQRQAFEYGVKISGCTVHFIDAGVDTGPIIDQMAVDIRHAQSADEAADIILEVEHKLIVRALRGLLCRKDKTAF